MKNRKTDFNAYEETSKKRRIIVPLPQVNQLRDQRCLSCDLNHNCLMEYSTTYLRLGAY